MSKFKNIDIELSQLSQDTIWGLYGFYKKYRNNKYYNREMSAYLNTEFFETLMFIVKIFKRFVEGRNYVPFTHDYTELKMFEDG